MTQVEHISYLLKKASEEALQKILEHVNLTKDELNERFSHYISLRSGKIFGFIKLSPKYYTNMGLFIWEYSNQIFIKPNEYSVSDLEAEYTSPYTVIRASGSSFEKQHFKDLTFKKVSKSNKFYSRIK